MRALQKAENTLYTVKKKKKKRTVLSVAPGRDKEIDSIVWYNKIHQEVLYFSFSHFLIRFWMTKYFDILIFWGIEAK